MVNHKCPALFLLTLQSQQLPAHSSELCPDPLLTPLLGSAGDGEVGRGRRDAGGGLCGHVLALRRQFPCQGVHVQRRGKSGCLHIPAFGSCCLSRHRLPLPYFLVCVCVCVVLPLAPGTVFTLCIQNNTT